MLGRRPRDRERGRLARVPAPASRRPPAPPSAKSPSPSPSPATFGQPADDGARITNVQALGDRLRDLTIDSPAVGIVTVRLLLPATFAEQPTTRFPVL